MAFSWKNSMHIQLLKLKDRRHLNLKKGNNVRAKELEHRIEKLEKLIKDGP